jgi:hypothetical protein
MTTIDDVCTRWMEHMTGRATDKKELRVYNVFPTGDSIYSYGFHFELARAIRNKRGKTTHFLLNGDTFSVSTSRHQRSVRSTIDETKLPRVIIPHSALTAASIDFDSIQILEASDDRTVTTEHETFEQPEGSQWRVDEVCHYVDLTSEELQAIVDRRHQAALDSWNQNHKWAKEDPVGYYATHWAPANEEPPKPMTVDQLGEYERREWRKVGTETHLYRSHHKHADRINVEILEDGRTRYSWITSRHVLGESLIRATVRWSTWIPCGTCKGTGHKPGIFRNHELFGTEEGRCPACRGFHGRSRSGRRRTKFLSGFDQGEPGISYFFCELPRCRATRIEEAYQALKPDVVTLAEQMGRTVHRQGDIFAVKLSDQITKRRLRKAGARFERRGPLLGTNHVATEVAYLPDGTTLARGILHHTPQGRRPDHVRVRLDGGVFHAIVKNTVPLSAA